MEGGEVRIIYGCGTGKTTAAIGMGIRRIAAGRTVSMVQFLKGNSEQDMLEVLQRLEPELKVFRFERFEDCYDELDETHRQEEQINIRNGLNFARKVMSTESCDVLILDEVLGIVDEGILTEEELMQIIDSKPDEMELILTGKVLGDGIKRRADSISRVEREK